MITLDELLETQKLLFNCWIKCIKIYEVFRVFRDTPLFQNGPERRFERKKNYQAITLGIACTPRPSETMKVQFRAVRGTVLDFEERIA